MDEFKEIVFISVSRGNETMDELKEKNCVNIFLTKVRRWMNFGNLTRKNRVMELWEVT
jgi:hypothetical protein